MILNFDFMSQIITMANIVDKIYDSYNIDDGHVFNLRILIQLLIKNIPLFLQLNGSYYVPLIIFMNIIRLRKNVNRSHLDSLFKSNYSDCKLFIEFIYQLEQDPEFMKLSTNEKIKLLSDKFMYLQKKRNDICISMNYNEKGILYDNILRREIYNIDYNDNDQQEEEICDCDEVHYVDEECPLCHIKLTIKGFDDMNYYLCETCGYTK